MIIEQKIMKSGYRLNKVTFKMREGDTAKNSHECAVGGKWVDKTTDDFFKGKRVVLFSLPGAFTPTCSSQQLPGFEKNCEQFKKLGVDEIYCCSVNDAYTMNAWADKMEIKNVKLYQMEVDILLNRWEC
jgi:peroxiredoxin